jgi:hypothetical protein
MRSSTTKELTHENTNQVLVHFSLKKNFIDSTAHQGDKNQTNMPVNAQRGLLQPRSSDD